ncbi:MAG: phosphoenolpyruvate synthase, partial [Methanoregula sp.]|nr:phosphoenolpyruvate synthase [Methanoregula sp.]
MKDVPNILWLEEIRKEDIISVGGKGASLGEMASLGLPVPRAFVVTAQAFRRFLVETGIEEKVFASPGELNVEDNAALERAADTAKSLVMKAKMPAAIKDEIKKAYKKMSKADLIVAVRSSATAEDLPDASFAGQQETYLNIKGEAALLTAVQMCWASLYGARAIYYRAKQGFDDRTVNIAVVVQQLVHSEKAGVMFTSHPITGEPHTIIEGSWGLGEAVVSGSVSPDNYIFDQRTEKVISRNIANKKIEIIADGDHGTKLVDIDSARQDAQVLSDEEVAKLAMYGKIAEDHYGIPQDVEWGIVAGTIYILQSRPITTIGNKKGAQGMSGQKQDAKIILQGQGAAPGKVVIIRDVKDTGAVKEGDILVTRMTNPDMVPAMRKVAAIITDEGGMTCHAAIVSRELGTPAIVGTKTATQVLKNGQLVTVDGERGLIYEGIFESAAPAKAATIVQGAAQIITATSVKVNVSIPEAATRAAATGADGVGLLRIEHLILGLNKTPGWFISNHKEEE